MSRKNWRRLWRKQLRRLGEKRTTTMLRMRMRTRNSLMRMGKMRIQRWVVLKLQELQDGKLSVLYCRCNLLPTRSSLDLFHDNFIFILSLFLGLIILRVCISYRH
ncbi:hypothetical protein ASPBRDRAFT_383174 [Aspergillus brasiliensis CBS 101740]|uniref:Uncharacterized protein n=1 Tax=Aspergillus brasiliensis (strain CBS 101740 / IMI 381727 / IBT 21946) TaxID=767769 RepID=A0A1L9UVX0_ASPBC|nr:hypothetical protein ASPBRDRAFT_383174 [Aspergillus brasiliensis CBS 101740]